MPIEGHDEWIVAAGAWHERGLPARLALPEGGYEKDRRRLLTRRRSLGRDHAAKIQRRGGDLLPDARLLAGREPGGIDAGLRDGDHRVEVEAERASEGSVLIAQVGLDEGRTLGA